MSLNENSTSIVSVQLKLSPEQEQAIKSMTTLKGKTFEEIVQRLIEVGFEHDKDFQMVLEKIQEEG